MERSFDKNWEKMYSKGKQLNKYPYDLVVSFVFRTFSNIPFKERKKIKILDLGCGAGNNSKFIAENGFSVYGIDGSDTVIKVCEKRFKEWQLEGKFTKCDFSKLPFPNNFFDLVIDRESLYANYLSDIKKTAKEIYRVLKNNGKLLSFMYSVFHPEIKLGEKVGNGTFKNFPPGSTFYQAGIVHFTDLGEILQIFSQFEIENIMRHSIIEDYNKLRKFIEFDEYIIIAKK